VASACLASHDNIVSDSISLRRHARRARGLLTR
jgi:hypothetical protein